MSVDRTNLIGRWLKVVTYTVRRDDVEDFLPLARGESVPGLNEETGKSETSDGPVIPPSFVPFVVCRSLLRAFDWERDFLFRYDTGTAMFGEQELQYARPLQIGDVLTVRSHISDVYQKRGKSVFDVIEVRFTGSNVTCLPVFSGAQSYLLFD